MTLFDNFPHNDTFEETRRLQLIASPVNTTADVYTFMHNHQDYGVLATEDAMLKATITVHHRTTGVAAANDQVVSVNMAPLKFGWKTKEVYINNQLISPQSSKENEITYTHHLLTAVPSNYWDEEDITLMILPHYHNDNDSIAAHNKETNQKGNSFDVRRLCRHIPAYTRERAAAMFLGSIVREFYHKQYGENRTMIIKRLSP
jgi:hypothetical protein